MPVQRDAGPTSFNPSLHPRAAGGRFGTTGGQVHTVPAARRKASKADALAMANSDDARANELQREIQGLRAQLRGLAAGRTSSHSTPKKSQAASKSSKAKSAKGAKSGSTGKAGSKSSAVRTSRTSTKSQQRRSIQGRIVMLQGQIMTLRQNALILRQDAKNM
jgi:hypothetical protein